MLTLSVPLRLKCLLSKHWCFLLGFVYQSNALWYLTFSNYVCYFSTCFLLSYRSYSLQTVTRCLYHVVWLLSFLYCLFILFSLFLVIIDLLVESPACWSSFLLFWFQVSNNHDPLELSSACIGVLQDMFTFSLALGFTLLQLQ